MVVSDAGQLVFICQQPCIGVEIRHRQRAVNRVDGRGRCCVERFELRQGQRGAADRDLRDLRLAGAEGYGRRDHGTASHRVGPIGQIRLGDDDVLGLARHLIFGGGWCDISRGRCRAAVGVGRGRADCHRRLRQGGRWRIAPDSACADDHRHRIAAINHERDHVARDAGAGDRGDFTLLDCDRVDRHVRHGVFFDTVGHGFRIAAPIRDIQCHRQRAVVETAQICGDRECAVGCHRDVVGWDRNRIDPIAHGYLHQGTATGDLAVDLHC